jgi:hypothetical protein
MNTTIKDCNFTGPVVASIFDGDMTQAVVNLSEGLRNLSRLFLAEGISISLLNIEAESPTPATNEPWPPVMGPGKEKM